MDSGTEGIWTRVEYIATAPDDAHSVVIELTLAWAATGTVWWDDILLCEEAPPPERFVRAMTVYHRPRHTKSPEENLEQFCQIIEAAPSTPDIICLPEGMAMVGTGRTYAEASESVPGPTTHCLGDLARRKQCYIVAGIYERVGSLIYNTAILIGRQGELVGTYRKTHLPREEVEGGLTPGDTHPVFQTDFGTIGILICWDMQFPEPARALALQGAEILLVPIAGGSEILTRARAIENHVFVVTSSYDMKTFIVGPTGEILAEASPEEPIAVADLPLDRKVRQPWVGDMKMRTWKERRPELPVPDFLPPYCSQSISHERRQ
jgi:predicted amidohydrolase